MLDKEKLKPAFECFDINPRLSRRPKIYRLSSPAYARPEVDRRPSDNS